jgi:hypothetical protein
MIIENKVFSTSATDECRDCEVQLWVDFQREQHDFDLHPS